MIGDVCYSFAQVAAMNADITDSTKKIAIVCFIAGFALNEIYTWAKARYGKPAK